MRRFVVYRETPPPYGNPADQVQFEGVEFTDGTVITKWRTEVHSMHTYPSFDEFWKIGGHGSHLRWLDFHTADEAAERLDDHDNPDGETPTLVTGWL